MSFRILINATKNRFNFIKGTIILLLFSVTLAYGQGGGVGSTRGDVGGTGGNRSIKGRLQLPGVDTTKVRFRVTLESNDSQTMFTTTDANGEFNFNGLTAGEFRITVEGNNEYETAREAVYIDRATGSSVNIVPIYMKLKPSADPAFADIPKPAVELYIKGMEAARKGDSKKAIENFNAAIAAHPSFAQAFTELGVQYLKKGELDKAAEALQNALKLKPDSFEARLNYGIVLLQKRDFANAETQLREAVKLRDSAATPHMYLGISLLSQKKNDEALAELEKTITLPGGDNLALAHKYLGGLFWGRDNKRAADELEKYVKLSPKAEDAERIRNTIKELRSKQ